MSEGGTVLLSADMVVVLDIDDTLYLEESYVRSGFGAVGRYLEETTRLVGVADTLWANFLAGVRGDAFDRALTAHGQEPDPETIAALVSTYRNHAPSIELLPDAAALLADLENHRTAVITDGPRESQRGKIDALGLEHFVDLILVTAELGDGMSKPHHRAFELVEERFDVSPGQCVYVGDNPAKDFVAPQQRGWDAVRVRRPASLHVQMATPPGVAEVSTLSDLYVRNRSTSQALAGSKLQQR